MDVLPLTDMHIVTSGGQKIPAHSNVLASASPVLENAVYRPRKYRESERVIQILGVPCDAVIAFLQLIYSSRTSSSAKERNDDAFERFGLHLVALSHKYGVERLKRRCEAGMARRLSAKGAVDALQVAKLCDASRLYQDCMRLICREFASVQRSEAWRFVQKNDPRLQLEILHFIQNTNQRKKRWGRERDNQEMYLQLNETMECLEHICTEGCTYVGPHDKEPPSKEKGPCASFRTCEGLQLLIRHFASCGKKFSIGGGSCPKCKRMWQLFRLHSSICDRPDSSCKVPLCKQFRGKMQIDGKEEDDDDKTWKLLSKKVITARVMSSLAKRKRPEHVQISLSRSRGRK